MAILVAYDGSEPAQKAVEYAVAQHPDEELVLLRVVELPTGFIDASINLAQEPFRDEPEDVARKVSEDVADFLDAEDVDFRIETAAGRPAREIVAFAEDNGIDGIIVGSHGRDGVSRVLLGSVAEMVVRRAPTPVTVVR
jgi:nucleotide-binding universal stress UspA family protein